MHNNLNRKRLVTCSIRTCATSAVLAAVITVAWAIRLIPPDRPLLVLMAFMWVAAVGIVAGVGAVVGYCQFSTAHAFTAGLRTGMAMDSEPEPHGRLQLVE